MYLLIDNRLHTVNYCDLNKHRNQEKTMGDANNHPTTVTGHVILYHIIQSIWYTSLLYHHTGCCLSHNIKMKVYYLPTSPSQEFLRQKEGKWLNQPASRIVNRNIGT